VHHLEKLLEGGCVRCHLPAASRKRAIQLIAELLADDEVGADVLFDELMQRERLGSTGLGDGVAIPHCRIPAAEMRAALVSLPQPVDFEAGDGEPVDLLFVLVVPESEQSAHLAALAVLAGIFSQSDNRTKLRACSSDDALQALFVEQLNAQFPDTKNA
jgi:PTS system nitrogen regulatory IIA component